MNISYLSIPRKDMIDELTTFMNNEAVKKVMTESERNEVIETVTGLGDQEFEIILKWSIRDIIAQLDSCGNDAIPLRTLVLATVDFGKRLKGDELMLWNVLSTFSFLTRIDSPSGCSHEYGSTEIDNIVKLFDKLSKKLRWDEFNQVCQFLTYSILWYNREYEPTMNALIAMDELTDKFLGCLLFERLRGAKIHLGSHHSNNDVIAAIRRSNSPD